MLRCVREKFMRIINFEKDKQSIIDCLKQGKIVVAPTETAYGLLANALDEFAVKKVFKIKGRDESKSLSVFMKDIEMAKKYVELNEKALSLAKKYLPGPLTLVLKLRRRIVGFKDTAGIRISSHKMIKYIMDNVDFPVTATSANIAGSQTTYSIDEAIKQFKDKKFQPDLIIDGGELEKGKISTVVDATDSRVKILRQGTIHLTQNSKLKV